MAKRTVTTLVDDLDGTELERGSGETISFGIDGRHHEIDLSDEHAAELRETLRRYAEAGRRVVPLGSHRRR